MRILCLMVLCCLHSGLAIASEIPNRPNILLILADDLGWSDVGWHGGFAKTPHLDKLVKEGVELDQHYVQPVCTPTRVALLSGRCPGRFGPHALIPNNVRAMPLGTETIASALKSLGYETTLSGKWHLGSKPEWMPQFYGFDHTYGSLCGAVDPWQHTYRQGPYLKTWHRDGKIFDEEGNATELVSREAIKYMKNSKAPWFVYVPFHAVHTPVDAPEEYKKLYDGVRFDQDDNKHDSRLRMAAMVSQLDAKVGEFIKVLEESDQRKNTLIIFSSDNGGIESLKNAYVGKVGHSPFNSENDPLRGQKNTLFEGGMRVCAFVNWPGILKPGKSTVPMYVGDWFPTIAELTGYQPAKELNWDGVSQWKILTGQSQADPERIIYIAHSSGQAIRLGDWKLITLNKGESMLFNLKDDPYEKTNLIQQKPDVAENMSKLIESQKAKDLTKIPEELKDIPNY